MPSPTSNAAQSPATGQRFLPRDRESFLEAQRRNRRATWRLAVLCVLAAVVMGIPLALIVTPLLYAVALIGADIVNLFSPLPPVLWARAGEFARFGFVALDWLLQHQAADPRVLAIGAAVMLLPGTVLSLALWMGLSTLFRRGGVGGALLALRAREPNPGDLKELQFADVVQEMAIAAGLPAPRVMLVDAPGANAAAIGTAPEDARLVVSRHLLDELSRDELEGALAHLIASIGNGDLRIAFRVTAVLETCGLLVAMINSPFGRQSRGTLWRIVRYGLAGSPRGDGAKEAAAVAGLLTRSVSLETDDIDRLFDTSGEKKSILRSIRNFLLFPIFFTNFAIKLSLWFFSLTVLGPSIALLWRTRQYLADASAVQMTRNPDGLAGALRKLSQDAGAIPGGGWASYLFLVSPGRGDQSAGGVPDARQKEILAQAWASSVEQTSSPGRRPGPTDFSALLNDFMATQRAAFAGDAQALARLTAAAQAVAALDPTLAAHIPNPADLMAARSGDAAAFARLKASRLVPLSLSQRQPQSGENNANEVWDISSLSFVPFHPSLKRRLKALDRMGAHIAWGAPKPKMGVVIFVLSLIFAPLFLLLIALFLLLIAMMTMASLTFLAVWLAVIHQIFMVVARH